jgi:carbonic anhydrase
LKYELTTTGVKASYKDSCEKPTVEIPGIPGVYQALQFHIHTSSEHTIDGEFFGAELHTVHAEVDGDRYAVVGMMIQPAADFPNEMFGELLDGWQAVYNHNEEECAFVGLGNGDRRQLSERRTAEAFSPYNLIPDGAAYYHYDGGLTTPPCSEVVWWNLADKPVAISPSQYSQLVEQIVNFIHLAECKPGTYAGPIGSTSRPTQPLNGRTVERICATSDSSTASLSFAALGATLLAGTALFF